MPVLYTSIQHGLVVDIETLNAEQKKLLKECFKLYLANCDHGSLHNRIYSADSMRICGHEYRYGKYWITPRSIDSCLYVVLRDILSMLGIRQGYARDDKSIDFSINEKLLDDFLK